MEDARLWLGELGRSPEAAPSAEELSELSGLETGLLDGIFAGAEAPGATPPLRAMPGLCLRLYTLTRRGDRHVAFVSAAPQRVESERDRRAMAVCCADVIAHVEGVEVGTKGGAGASSPEVIKASFSFPRPPPPFSPLC